MKSQSKDNPKNTIQGQRLTLFGLGGGQNAPEGFC